MRIDWKEVKVAFSITIAVIRKPKMVALLLLGCLLFLAFEGNLLTLPAFLALMFVLIFWITFGTLRQNL